MEAEGPSGAGAVGRASCGCGIRPTGLCGEDWHEIEVITSIIARIVLARSHLKVPPCRELQTGDFKYRRYYITIGESATG